MVKIQRKPLSEIRDCIEPYGQIITIGCGGCASVCLAGGQKEVGILNSELNMYSNMDGGAKKIHGHVVERQCNDQFLAGLDDMVAGYDCILSMACGAGTQLLAEKFRLTPVFPTVNTVFIGVDRAVGMYEEKCRACGHCVLGYTGGICPVTRCAKGIFNGPCGGTNQGKCEINQYVPCAWHDIFTLLSDQGRVDQIIKVQPPMAWQNQIQRTIVQTQYSGRYTEFE